MTPRRVVALDPGHRGIGFAVFERDPFRLIDWGIKTCRVSDQFLRLDKALNLIGQYEPEAVVLEDWRRASRLRREALRPYGIALEEALVKRDLPLVTYSSNEVRDLFVPLGITTKSDMARALAIRFPELLWRVPPARRAWMTEDHQMVVFDAVALALAHIDASANGTAP